MMPIKDKSLYPKDWKAISERIRERDGQKCKFCGAPNHGYIMRSEVDPSRWCMDDPETSGCLTYNGELYKWSEAPSEYNTVKMIKVVLTVAHLDHNPQNNKDDNLVSLCQRCHLRYDHKQHLGNSRVTRAESKKKRLKTLGQEPLL